MEMLSGKYIEHVSVSTANKVNLEWEEAKDSLEKSLIKSISGIF